MSSFMELCTDQKKRLMKNTGMKGEVKCTVCTISLCRFCADLCLENVPDCLFRYSREYSEINITVYYLKCIIVNHLKKKI